MTPLTWLELSKLDAGARLLFTTTWDIYPECIVPEGCTATVKENGLNEIGCLMFIEPDDDRIREALRDWDGLIQFGAHLKPGADLTDLDDPDAQEWKQPSPVALLGGGLMELLENPERLKNTPE